MEPLRIAVKPQKWLFVLNLFVQPCLFAGGVAALWGHEWVLGSFLTLVGGSLSYFSVVVLLRMRGRVIEIVLDADTIEIPGMLSGKVQRIAVGSLRRGRLQETDAGGVTSFWQLNLVYDKDGRERTAVVSSQLVGLAAFNALCAALRERGIEVV